MQISRSQVHQALILLQNNLIIMEQIHSICQLTGLLTASTSRPNCTVTKNLPGLTCLPTGLTAEV